MAKKAQIIVGITGGIGSGKTTIARYMSSFGIPLYIADDEAKALMNRSKVIKRKLIQLFGKSAYKDGELNRPYLAKQIFNDQGLLSKMNAIVHPKVAAHFKRWLKKQEAPYVLKEAAIIFENNLEYQYDKIITVIADKELRISRILSRTADTSVDKIERIMAHQLSDEEKASRSDFVILNNDLESAKAQAETIHHQILSSV